MTWFSIVGPTDLPPADGRPYMVTGAGGGAYTSRRSAGSTSTGRSASARAKLAPVARSTGGAGSPELSRAARARAALARAVANAPPPGRQLAQVHDLSEDDPARGFASLPEFLGAVRRACLPTCAVPDRRLTALYDRGDGPLFGDGWVATSGYQAAPVGFMSGGSGTAGEGYLIPPLYREEIMQVVYGEGDLAGLVRDEVVGNSEVRAPTTEAAPWGTEGLQIGWSGDGSLLAASKPQTRGLLLELLPCYCFVTATEELGSDAPRFAARIKRSVALAFQWTLSESFMHDAGVDRPMGWLNSPAAVEVPKEAAQTAGTIVSANILKMHARRLITPAAQYTWLASSTAIPQLADLQTATGNALFRQGAGRPGDPEGSMLGIPVMASDHCPELGDSGDIQLVALKTYYAPRRDAGMQADTSIHVFFDYSIGAYRFMIQTNGQPLLSAPVTPAHGTDTVSHFIALAERA